MTTIITVLAVWGIGSIVFMLALAVAAAKSSPVASVAGNVRMETAEEILKRLNLVDTPRHQVPVHARAARAH